MHKKAYGFTIVELLIVIVVIAILATVTIVAYNGIQERSRMAKIKTDLSTLSTAVQLARVNESKTLMSITGSMYTAHGCAANEEGTDLAALPKTDGCWLGYFSALQSITAASGVDVSGLVDPWGRPYFIDENEGENGGCNRDVVAVYRYPFARTTPVYGEFIRIPVFQCS